MAGGSWHVDRDREKQRGGGALVLAGCVRGALSGMQTEHVSLQTAAAVLLRFVSIFKYPAAADKCCTYLPCLPPTARQPASAVSSFFRALGGRNATVPFRHLARRLGLGLGGVRVRVGSSKT